MARTNAERDRPDASEREPRRVWRRLLALTAVLVALALVSAALVAGLAIAVSRGWQRERIVAALEAEIGSALGTPVRIAALRGPLLPGFEVQGVRVGPAGRELGTIRRVAVRLDLDALLGWERIVIDDLLIEGLALSLRRDASGWNLPALPETPGAAEAGAPLPILVRRARVIDSRVDLSVARLSPAPAPAPAPAQPQSRSAQLPGAERAGTLSGGFAAEVRDVLLPAGSGALAWGAANLSLSVESGELAGTRVERGALEAELDAAHRVRFTAVTGGAFGEIGLQGRGDLDAWLSGRIDPDTRVDLAVDALDLGALTGGRAPATRLDGSAELAMGPRTGPGGAPEILWSAALDASRLGPLALTRAHLRGALQGDAWQIESLSLEGRGLLVTGEASGVGAAPERVDLKARVERLERVSAWLEARDGIAAEAERSLAGSLVLDVQLVGRPGEVSGHVSADARDLVWRGTAVGDVALRAAIHDGERAVIETLRLRRDSLSVEVEPGAVVRRAGPDAAAGVLVEGLRARSEGATLAADGRVSADAVHGLRLQLEGLHLPRLGALAGIAVPTAGRIDADLSLDGPFERPRAEGWLSLRDGAASFPVVRETFAPIEGRVRLEQEVLIVEGLTVGPPGARAEVSGRIALPDFRPGRADLHLRVDDFPLTRVPLPADLLGDLAGGGGEASADATGREAGVSPEPEIFAAGGRVDADLTLKGPLLAPTVAGDLDWRQPRWEDVQLERVSLHLEADEASVRGGLRVRYAGREILVAEAGLPVPEDARAPLDWLGDERARIEIRGESLDFALLSPFLTRLVRDPRGTADLRLVVRGGRPEPAIDGLVTVADGSLRVPLLGQTFAPVAGSARFDGRQVRLESISVGTPEAGLEAEGTLELVDLRPARVDLALHLANFPASRSPLVTANVDGHVELAGPVSAPALTGELALRETRVTVRSGTDPVAREVSVRTTTRDESLTERARGGPGVLDRASVDVALTVPGGTWIRSPDLELDVEGWARFEKRSLEPARISGELSTRRGTVRVMSRRFVLRRGQAVLDGGSESDPVLDIEAIHPVAGVVVVAYVTGRASEPALRLESEPVLPEDDIVSYLFFGRPASQLGAGEQGDVSLAAAGLAAGMALDELRGVFGHDLPIDTIDLRLQEGDEPSQVGIGKYVAKDVFIRYGHTFGSEPVEEVGVSYRIDENWRIESTTSSDAAAGADVFWTIDY